MSPGVSIHFSEHGFEHIEGVFGSAADRMRDIAERKMIEMAPEFFRAAVEPLHDVTERMHFRTGRLAESTQVMDDSIEIKPWMLNFTVIQPAESEPGVSPYTGKGGFHYAQMVLPPWWTNGPMRRRLTAPRPIGPTSQGKMAFAGPGFGPVKAFTQYAGDPYPLLASPEIETAYERLASRYAREVLEEVFHL